MSGLCEETQQIEIISLSDDQALRTLVEKNPVDSWASLAGKNVDLLFHGIAAEHVSQVRPIFLAYKSVSWEAHHLPIAEITSSIAQTVDDTDQIDGIQAMKSGWNIYMKTEVDRAQLLMAGLNIASHVSLVVSCKDNTESIKLIIKDLPLHKVSNQDVLAILKENFEVLSDVKYSNIFINGKCTHLWNGDCFVYISPDQVAKVPLTLNC